MRRSRTTAVPPAPDPSSSSPRSAPVLARLDRRNPSANPGHPQSDRGPAARGASRHPGGEHMNATDTPKALPVAPPGEGTIAQRVAAGLGLRPSPLDDWHLSRLAIVYVRQSDPQQVLDHIESRERQYALVDLAVALGWPRDRILVIDEDQGQQWQDGRAADRISPPPGRGYHGSCRLDPGDRDEPHGPQQQGLASSHGDVRHLRDAPGGRGRFYDPRDPEDRLLLGFKGTISEYELILMHNRLERGRLHKAKRASCSSTSPAGMSSCPPGKSSSIPTSRSRRPCRWSSTSSTNWAPAGGSTAIWSGTRSAWGSAPPRAARGQLEWRLPIRGPC